MEQQIFQSGWIEVICGPMFSGKSEELMRRLRRATIARKRVQVFKSRADDRYSASEIVSHSDIRMASEPVDSALEILPRVDWRTQVIGIDEANFFGSELVDIATQLADGGKQVILAGLDTDYMGRPFSPIPDLLAIAELITKMLAICISLRDGCQAYPALSRIKGTYSGWSRRFVRSQVQALLRTGSAPPGNAELCRSRDNRSCIKIGFET